MRLLCVTNLFPDQREPWRGLDNVTLLHAMKEQRPETDLRVLCVRPSPRFWLKQQPQLKPRAGDEPLNPSYHYVPHLPKLGGANHLLYHWGIRRARRALPPGWQPDALLVPWLFPDACGVRLVREWQDRPLLAVAQGSDVHQYLNFPARRRAILRLAQNARILTRSDDLRQRLIAAGAPTHGVHTLYNGVDTSTFHPGDPLTARRRLNLPETGNLLLFVGNFLPVKGLDLLIHATAQVAATRPVHLVLIGSGPLQEDIRGWIESSRLGLANVTFAGRKAPAEVAEYMRAADAVCLSSHNEGVPNVLLESFASGRSFVSTAVGGISEITNLVDHGGFLTTTRSPTDYADLLQKALQHPPSSEALSNFACQFSWQRCAQRYWEQCDTLIQTIL